MTLNPTSPVGEQQPVDGPDEQLAQRLDALDRANRVRTARARLKRDLKAGRAQIAAILREPPECVKTAKVTELLLALPKYGRVRTDRVLAYCRIPASAKLGSLSEQKRADLARSVASHAPQRPATMNVVGDTIADRALYQQTERALLAEGGVELPDEPVCRECGCSDSLACPEGCGWAQPDLCTECDREITALASPTATTTASGGACGEGCM